MKRKGVDGNEILVLWGRKNRREIRGGVWGEIIGFIDCRADSIQYIEKIPVYTYDVFKSVFSKESERIIITAISDMAIDDILRILGRDNLLSYVEGVYRGDKIQKIQEIWMNPSTSQYGEDMALRHLMAGILPAKGIYVDVGAYHPFRYSNTWFLHEMGWSGINIDANADVIRLFDLFRKTDRNINSGVSDKKEKDMIYYMFSEGGYNTFDSGLAEARKSKSMYLGSRAVPVQSLNEILEKEDIDHFDYLNIDVEGFDEKVIMGFDFKRYRPRCVSIECCTQTIEEYLCCDMHKRFSANNYKLFGYYYPSVIYIDKDYWFK